MIRRGPQYVSLLCSVLLLGAASCFGQVSYPSQIELVGFGIPAGGSGSLDGVIPFSFSPWEELAIYQAPNIEAGIAGDVGNGIVLEFYVATYEGNPSASFTILPGGEISLGSGPYASLDEMFPNGAAWTVYFDGLVYAAGNIAGTGGGGGDPYEENFPDWESAAVKIPLGFSLAMAFWAACVAASVSMKWVRDLASAAS